MGHHFDRWAAGYFSWVDKTQWMPDGLDDFLRILRDAWSDGVKLGARLGVEHALLNEPPAPAPPPPVTALQPWTEPGDGLDEGDLDVARHDLEGLSAEDTAIVLARYQHWLGTWQAWARTLVQHPDPLTMYGDSGARQAIRAELVASRLAVSNALKVYVCRECRAEIGTVHKMSCHAETRTRKPPSERESEIPGDPRRRR